MILKLGEPDDFYYEMKAIAKTHNFERFDPRAFFLHISPEPKYNVEKTKTYRLKLGKNKQIKLSGGTYYLRFAQEHNYLMFFSISPGGYDHRAREAVKEKIDFVLPRRFGLKEGQDVGVDM